MLAIVAPGQGSQVPGFLSPWLDLDCGGQSVAERLAWWTTVTGIDLLAAGTTDTAETIRDTQVAQPLLVACGLATAGVLFGGADPSDLAAVVAGHSVGELTAAAIAGAITDESALALVAERGRAMAAAAAATPTTMAAVLGGDAEVVLAKLAELGLTAANRNGAGQIVAAGTVLQVDALLADPPAGSRVRPLQVAGAFHTEHMAPAVDRLAAVAAGVEADKPRTVLLSNADGGAVTGPEDLLDRLVAQVSAPVRWDLCTAALASYGITGVLELGPGGTLTGVLKRALPGVDLVALKSPDDLDAAHALIDRHTTPHAAVEPSPTNWRLLVAPSGGTFHPVAAEPGTVLEAGATLGIVQGRRESTTVASVHAGVLLEWLAQEGDPVSEGQPVARVYAGAGA
ncbi:MAG: [acyl-carrier-protein] S-malonyltransferase [Frankiaceae bacterium]|nr:[acyl-carrier-protein] S-malonyltransferase [Frankiaceae bacterium]